MNRESFKNYLKIAKGYPEGTISSRVSNCGTIEKYYGDLDVIYQENQFSELLKDLEYTTEDERNNAPARHKIAIDGDLRKGTASLKSALNLYKEFKDNEDVFALKGDDVGFKYEADLEKAIYAQASQLFPAYDVKGKQYKVGDNKNRMIDILLVHKEDKSFLVVEIKTGEIDREAFGQISEYMVLLQKEHPNRLIKGCLIGSDFEDNIADTLQSSKYEIALKKYNLNIILEDI